MNYYLIRKNARNNKGSLKMLVSSVSKFSLPTELLLALTNDKIIPVCIKRMDDMPPRYIDADGKEVGNKYRSILFDAIKFYGIKGKKVGLIVDLFRDFHKAPEQSNSAVTKIAASEYTEHHAMKEEVVPLSAKIIPEHDRSIYKQGAFGKGRFVDSLCILEEYYIISYKRKVHGPIPGRLLIELLGTGEAGIVARGRKVAGGRGNSTFTIQWFDVNNKHLSRSEFFANSISITDRAIIITADDLTETFIDHMDDWFIEYPGRRFVDHYRGRSSETVKSTEEVDTTEYDKRERATQVEPDGLSTNLDAIRNNALNAIAEIKDLKNRLSTVIAKRDEYKKIMLEYAEKISRIEIKQEKFTPPQPDVNILTNRAIVDLNKMIADENKYTQCDVGAVVRFCLRTEILVLQQVPVNKETKF